ncbi:MAG: L-2-amino-thiazoline-4-carboxylic acid hydrolase [Clostridia bacterium]|nr:L-2-amino-thiazoline-4-carboxylic acid hydrolase [Clostridia bacterium]
MGFNERTHAYISARFYIRLTESFGERGRAAFIHAVQCYAERRGRRMARRALRDGAELSYAVFMQYGELAFTDEVERTESETVSLAPDYERRITVCPWHAQFRDMDCAEAGDAYCSHVDEALVRGFSPDIVFQAPVNLNRGGYCLHRVVGANYASMPAEPPRTEYRRDFAYHCGHLFRAYRDAVAAIFGAAGEENARSVLEDFAARYGADMAAELERQSRADFEAI